MSHRTKHPKILKAYKRKRQSNPAYVIISLNKGRVTSDAILHSVEISPKDVKLLKQNDVKRMWFYLSSQSAVDFSHPEFHQTGWKSRLEDKEAIELIKRRWDEYSPKPPFYLIPVAKMKYDMVQDGYPAIMVDAAFYHLWLEGFWEPHVDLYGRIVYGRKD